MGYDLSNMSSERLEQIVRAAVTDNFRQFERQEDRDEVFDPSGYPEQYAIDSFDLAMAKRLVEAAEEAADERGLRIVAAVCDRGGNLVALHRMDDSLLCSLDVAQGKAFTALSLKIPTSAGLAMVKANGHLTGFESSNNGRIILFGGGVPLFVDGVVVGGLGISGGSIVEDTDVVEAAIRSVQRGR